MRFMFKTLRAIKHLVMGPIVLAILFVVNWATFSGEWWVKWAALWIGIIWIISLIRVLSALVLLGGLAGLIAYVRKKSL
jgi:hypothetical protein